jgi:hypothetical protein
LLTETAPDWQAKEDLDMKEKQLLLAGFSLAILTAGLLAGAAPLCAASPSAPEVTRVAIQGEPFSGLERQEPILAALLLGVVQEDADHHAFLVAESYLSGTTAGSHGNYKYHGAFLPRANGEVGFIFDLDSLADRSSITYSGLIGPNAAAVAYTRVSRDSTTAKAQVEKAQWTAAAE